MSEPGRNAGLVTVTVLLAGFLASSPAHGDDLTTLSGQTFHDVQPVRVEPDGITWKHAEGVAKVDFSDSPATVRAAYHYDAGKAAAYHEARAQAQRQAEEQARQLLQARDDRLRARAQAQAASTDQAPPTAPGKNLVYRHGLAPAVEAATRSVGEQMAAAKARVAADVRNSEGLGNPALWSWIPGMGRAPVAPRMDVPNSEEFKSALSLLPGSAAVQTLGASQGPAGAFGANSADDPLFKPIYMTKSYNDDVDRAAAFARGVPLK